jgi:RND family efflux transporter MFP subunit
MNRLAAWVVVVLAGCAGKGEAPAGGPPKGPPPAREVEVLSLAPSEVRETGEYLGTLLSRESVNVLPQVTGYVRSIHVKPGQRVEAGALLVEIDAREESAALDNAEAQRRQTDAHLDLAKQTAARTEALYNEGLASGQELERARSDVRAAEAATRAAVAAVSQRQVQLQYHEVRAAVPGVIGEVPIRVGDHVNASTLLTSIAQADVLEVSVSIPAARARTLRPDTPVEILDDAGNVIVKSKVYYLAPQADPRTQLVEVKAAFQNQAGLRPNEVVRTRLVYATRDALQVPALAVFRLSGQPFVFALTEKDGKTVVERRAVTLGALGDQAYVVEKGLDAGTRVAVSSLQMLRDGAPVVPKAPAAPSAAPASAAPASAPASGPSMGAK